jgi:hypothetical protein
MRCDAAPREMRACATSSRARATRDRRATPRAARSRRRAAPRKSARSALARAADGARDDETTHEWCAGDASSTDARESVDARDAGAD